ncbi:receptor-like protein 50 [Quercus lobata]|uniref:receptor-like protein 50 n=1 Tax=Quercus lobata TaxID=97700 RepID=UPI001247EAA9|nr:receptor-like protein 50 [Quercus lobata]
MVKVRPEDLDCAEMGVIGWTLSVLATVAADTDTADLSLNDFHQDSIPEFIGSLQYIEYLNLSNANFRGTIPTNLGNLSHLEVLDLSGNCFSLKADNLNWVYGLSSLKVLYLGGVDLSNADDWLDAVNMLPTLVELSLFFCKFHKLPQNLPHVNFTSLKILDLSYNDFSSTIPDWLFDIGHSLVYLNLSRCPIPLTLGLFQKKGLPLSTSSSLRELYLSNNRLNGSLEQSLAQFSQLVVLNMAGNHLEGNITEAQLQKFRSLQVLDLSSNRYRARLVLGPVF